MAELIPCPWCNGRAGITARQMRFIGQNFYGAKKIRFAANGKCYKCHARGPVVTAVIITDTRETNAELDALYRRAEEAWNRRNELPKEPPAPICQTCRNFETCPWRHEGVFSGPPYKARRVLACSDYKTE